MNNDKVNMYVERWNDALNDSNGRLVSVVLGLCKEYTIEEVDDIIGEIIESPGFAVGRSAFRSHYSEESFDDDLCNIEDAWYRMCESSLEWRLERALEDDRVVSLIVDGDDTSQWEIWEAYRISDAYDRMMEKVADDYEEWFKGELTDSEFDARRVYDEMLDAQSGY